MKRIKDVQLTGAAGRPFLLDLHYMPDGNPKPIVIFAHGFKGFKDWGHWHLIADQFAQAGYVFLKFNFSHNGTTIAKPADFADLEAFGQNNYSRELADLNAVMIWLHQGSTVLPAKECDLGKIFLVGHSRGGPIALLHTEQDPRIKAAAGWASVSSLAYAWQSEEMMRNWEKEGVYHVVNGRTGQQMPIYYQMYRDYRAKQEAFDLKSALQRMEQPILLVHGTEDPAVPYRAAQQMKSWQPKAEVQLIEGADHVFGGRHPFEGEVLPAHSQALCDHTLRFFNLQLN